MRRSTCGRSTRRGSRCSCPRRAISSCRTRRAFEFGGSNFAGDEQDVEQRAAVLLAQYRSRRRRAGEHHRRRQIVRANLAASTIGGLSVYTDRTETATGQMLSAFRVTSRCSSNPRLGFIFTNGDPTGLTENTVAGVDFQYRNSNLFGDKTVLADVFYQRSFSNVRRRRRFVRRLDRLSERALGRRCSRSSRSARTSFRRSAS